MENFQVLVSLFLLLYFCNTVVVNGAERPGIAIPRADKAPVINGDLDDQCWEKAVAFPDFLIWGGGGKSTDAIKTRAVFDDEWLYFAFEVAHPHPELIYSEPMAPDSPLAGYDSVEVFVEPGTGGETYLHYMLSAGNARSERRCTERGASKETMWKVPWRSATKITETGWQAEIAIPLAVVAEYGSLDGLTMLIGANRVIPTRDKVGALVDTKRETSSWVPASSGFHHPASFGTVKGLEKVKPKTPFLVSSGALETSSYGVDEAGEFFYEVTGIIEPFTAREGTVLVVVEDKPIEGEGVKAEKNVAVGKGKDNSFSVRVPVKAFSDRTAELKLTDPETGEIWQLVPLRDMAGLSLMRSFVRYSYYTDEKEAEVVCQLGLPQDELKKMRLEIKDASGKTLARADDLKKKTVVTVPLKRFMKSVPEGTHAWTVELQRANGEVAVGQDVVMVKRKPRPGSEWKIDFETGCILNNGEPFFPFGIMAMIPSDDDEAAEIMCQDLADIGFNTVVRWKRPEVENVEKLLDLGKKYEFYVVDWPSRWRYTPPEGGEGPPKPEEGMDWVDIVSYQLDWNLQNHVLPKIKEVMSHPNLMAYYLWDEPQLCLKSAAAIGRMHKAYHEIDGYRPTQVLYSPPVPSGSVYSENCDILGIDPYWVPGAGAGELGNPNRVGRHTWLARMRGDADMKLSWVTPVASRWSASRIRVLNVNEQKVQSYLTLIHGAQGLLYFVYPFWSQTTYEAFKELGDEMKILGPACVAGEVPQTAKYTPVPLDPFNNVFPDVQTSLKRNPDGGYILLAANWRAYPVEASISVSLLGESDKVEIMFSDNLALDVKDSSFTDTFEPMSTRAYAIHGPVNLTDAVDITVDLKAVPEKTDTFYTKSAIPASGMPGKKNILRNSSFEEVSIPHMADYYFYLRTRIMGELGWRVGDLRGDAGAGVSTEHAFDGKNSMRLRGDGGNSFMLFWITPNVTEPTPFVFSAWVKGDGKPDTKLSFYGPVDAKTRRHDVTGEWTRVYATGTALPQPQPQQQNLFGFYVGGKDNTVWVDAIQFELGTELTDYEP